MSPDYWLQERGGLLMAVLVHSLDLKLYSQFVEHTTIYDVHGRVQAFYAWARAKGYKTHESLLCKQQARTSQKRLEEYA